MNASDYPLTLFYDGACPLCVLEMEHLMARNALRRLVFVNIAAPGFDAATQAGGQATLAQMCALIHGLRPDGTLLVGVQVLRLAYEAVGLGALVAPLGLTALQPLAGRAYAVFARNRLGLSRLLRPLIHEMAARRPMQRAAACANGTCATEQERSTS